MAKPILFFDKNDRYFELSNFYMVSIAVDGKSYPSVEHYFHAMKFYDEDHAEKIRQAGSPQMAKQLGQSRKFKIKSDWDDVKEAIMLKALRVKFSAPELRELLIGTKKRPLIENSPYDKYWGIGRNGKGKNRLGELLMLVRSELTSG